MKYVAFLRGINVGGHKIIKMEDLRKRFAKLGYENVASYRASGNVLFESSKAAEKIQKEIEEDMHKFVGAKVGIILRTIPEMKEMVEINPFKAVPGDGHKYVVLISAHPKEKLKVPLNTPNNDVEVISFREREFFCLAHKVDGKSGYPNGFIEKKFGLPATTRNWETIKGVASYWSE